MLIHHRLLAIAALPLCLGTLGTLTLAQAGSANSPQLIAQNSVPNAPSSGGKKSRPRLDLAAAASKLGISEDRLRTALGIPATPPTNGERPPRPDIKGAAAKLGISEATLVQALGLPPRPPRPDFAAAATKLGVSEAQLKAALGVPATPPANGERPPRPDFAAAAAKLGVTEQQLVEALGVPPRPPAGESR